MITSGPMEGTNHKIKTMKRQAYGFWAKEFFKLNTLAIHETLMPDLDVTPAPHPYLVAKVAGGETGMAAGRGFREWSPQEARVVHDRLDAYLAEAAHESG